MTHLNPRRNRFALWGAGILLQTLLAQHGLAQDPPRAQVADSVISVDFQDADLRTVLLSLATSASLNIALGDLPAKRVTLRLRQAVRPGEMLSVLKSLASTYEFALTEEAGIIRVAALPPTPAAAAPGQRDVPGTALIYIHRLRHARAATLAATLQSVFSARGSGPSMSVAGAQVPLSQRLREGLVPPAGTDAEGRASAAPPPFVPPGGIPTTAPPIAAQLRSDISILPDEATNSLIVRAQPADWTIVRQAVEAMDLRPLEVLIEVVIAAVREARDLELGVSAAGSNPADGGKLTGTLGGSTTSDFVATLTRDAGAFKLNLALSALASRGKVRILSRPLLIAQNNREARMLVGSQRPFVQVSRALPTDAGVRDQVVQYREVGTSLSILPTINADGYVNLQILQEVSSATSETQFGAPVISTRETSTHLLVKDGQTGVIGGLVDRQDDRTRSGIPILSAIPLIGSLFGSSATRTTTSELFLFVTPHVIARDEDVDRIRDALKKTDAAGAEDPARGLRSLIRPPPP